MYGSTQYGLLQYSQNTPDDEQIISYSPDLMKYLPFYYSNSEVMKNIQTSISKEIGRLYYSVEDILNQFFIDTATWSLNLWEKELGIKTDISKSYEFRREIIKAKLRGTGTVTKKMLKNTVLAYTNAEVSIIENPQDYSFIIKFIGVKGIPKNMAGLIETIENIKPAHLAYSFEYTFSWWNNIKSLTWTQAKTNTWNQLREY
jgi:uncharacterized protein YmfQ (DUF2313 family)